MRRRLLGCIAGGVFLCQGGVAVAQSSLDALIKEFEEVKQEHDEASSLMLTTFFTQIDAAMASPDAAVALYQHAGGDMPAPTPVTTQHQNETPTEKAARLAQDQAKLARLGAVLQIHCGLMHYAALFVVKPDQKGLQEEWVAWLQKTADAYSQLNAVPEDNAPTTQGHHQRKRGQGATAPASQIAIPGGMKTLTMRDSLIGKFLGFNVWGEKEQGEWAVADLPKLFRTNVLEPLRISPTAATLVAWDGYIAMMNADEPDNDKWNQVEYPPLAFDRACDDYAIRPSMEKLEGLLILIKANPGNPQADDWISRAHKMLDDFRASRGGHVTGGQSPAPVPPPATGNPNVSVTTEQQGDATVITTHTNSAPVTNAPPTQ